MVRKTAYGAKRTSAQENSRARRFKTVPSRKTFRFDDKPVCVLDSVQCTSSTKLGPRCKRRVVVGVDKCWAHTVRDYKVRVVNQRLRGQDIGKGLEAAADLKKGHIIPYFGQLRAAREFNRAYPQDATAPYAIKVTDNLSLDAACLRSIGSLVNHDSHARNINCAIEVDFRKRGTRTTGRADIVLTKNVKKGTPLFWNYNAPDENGNGRSSALRYKFDSRHRTG